MRSNIYCYILGMLAGLLCSLTARSADSISASIHPEKLQILIDLIDHNLPYTQEMPSDSIISLEKELEPQLEAGKQYDLLFYLKLLVTKAYTNRGDITIAVDRAHLMYQQAKKMGYNKGIALSLHATGDAYLASNMQQQAIGSYEEAIRILDKSNDGEPIKIHILPNLILALLQTGKTDEAHTYLKQFEKLFDKYPTSSNLFYISICRAFYQITTNQPDKAQVYLAEAARANAENDFIFMNFMLYYMYASYYELTGQYNLALEQYDKIIGELRPSYAPYQHIQLNIQRARLLAKQGQTEKACLIYQRASALQDSLDNLSYVRQINELRNIYQTDQLEIENQQERNRTILWGILAVLSMLGLITILFFLTKKENKQLSRSKEKLEKAQLYAENSIKAKSLFLSNMSHEIRTPLNALSGFSAILTDASIDNDTRRQCDEIIQQNSELLLKLINDVVDLSSVDVGKLTFNLKENDAVVICRNVVETVEKVKQTQAEVRFVTTLESLPLVTDNSRLQQLLINLLINATKFTTEGTITLEVGKESDTVALFSVTDTGCGIPLEKQDRIFNRFEKLDESAQGTGLGLFICQLIIEQIGGRIWIDHEYTEGARFMFTHPITPVMNRKENTRCDN